MDKEDDYHFSEDDNSNMGDFQPPRSSISPSSGDDSGQHKEPGSRKKLVLLIGLVVAGVCLYKLYGLFTVESAQKSKVEMPVPVQHKPVELPKPVKSVPESPVSVSDEAGTKITGLEKTVAQIGQANSSLQDQVAGLSTAMSDIQNNIANITQQVSALTQAQDQAALQKQEKIDAEKKAEAQKLEKEKLAREKLIKARQALKEKQLLASRVYYIKAMIQGRAWLVTPEGTLFTVSEGDNLPGYGNIDSIHPDKGIIMTSSGRVVAYQIEAK